MNGNWEEALLGTIINDPQVLAACGELLPSDFTGPNQTTYAEIIALERRQAVGARALIETLRTSPDFARHSGVGTPDLYVANLMQHRGSEPDEYIRQVLNAAIKKAVRRNCALIAAEAEGSSKTADELVDFAEGKIMSLRRNHGEDILSMNDLITPFMPRLASIMDGTFVPVWQPNIEPLKDIIDFVEPSESLLYAARPGIGKSSLLRYELGMDVIRNHKKVGIINMENDENDYVKGFLSLFTGINGRKIKKGNLTPQELESVKLAAEILAKMPIYLVSMASPTALEIRRKIRQLVAKHQIDQVGVDYLQLADNGKDKKNDDVSITSQVLRASARELKIPHHNVAQLNRAIEVRGDDAEPQLSDLRDSGSLEQDHTIIAFIKGVWNTQPEPAVMAQFEENLDPITRRVLPRPRAVPVRLYVRKNRNGEIGTTEPILFDKGTGRFTAIRS